MQSFNLEPEVFQRLQTLMKDASGIFLPDRKKALVSGRLQKRLRALGLASFREYNEYLQHHPDERRIAIDLLTTNETRFFREPRHFDLVASIAAGHAGPLRLWSAACSSGEEPYTMAMVLSESARHGDWEIVASDLSQRVLEKARSGTYPVAQESQLSREQLRRYCLRGTGRSAGLFRIKPGIRQRIRFCSVNLNEPLPGDLGRFDIVFIRNVLIYFDVATKRRILERVLLQMAPGGYLFLGHSESVQGLGLPLVSVAPAAYRKER
jgi:chemotaxis protein methyltransferase CheR